MNGPPIDPLVHVRLRAWLASCSRCGGPCFPSSPTCKRCTPVFERTLLRLCKLRKKYGLPFGVPAHKLRAPRGLHSHLWPDVQNRLERYEIELVERFLRTAARALASAC